MTHGGQNPIEAWAAGAAALAGRHMQNFRDIATAGEERGVLTRVADGPALGRALTAALADPEGTRRIGREAARLVAENRGAAEKTAAAVVPLFAGAARGRAS